MPEITRMRLRVKQKGDDAWVVTFEDADGGELGIAPREMRRIDDLPLPPADDLPENGTPHTELCTPDGLAKIREFRKLISKRDIRDNIVELYGRYLYACLLGSRWQGICASAPDERMLDIALCIEDDADPLHRLHWEMMHGPDRFLGSGKPRRVSISRSVDSDAEATTTASPPRILFIIGTNLNDRGLRSGAEVVGLLRDIQHNGRSIHSRILQHASPSKIRAAMKTFAPDVVHFICHGGIDRKGVPFLELETDEDEQDRNRTADQVHSMLDAGEKQPTIVILSACYTANSGDSAGMEMRPEDTSPFAAQLVREGIPVVVGMSGRVSDLACRLFTRCFGEAIVDGQPLVVAAERGRRVAFSDGQQPKSSVDWAYPTLYLANKVPVEYTSFDAANSQSYSNLEREFCDHHVFDPRKPVFCGRDDIFEAYYRLFEDGGPVVLAIRDNHPPASNTQIGRTRLLQTLGLQALRDGHIPCLIAGTKEGWIPPRSISDFIGKLDKAVKNVRGIFGLDRNHSSELLRLKKRENDLIQHASDPATDIRVREAIEEIYEKPVLTIEVVREALCADLARTRKDIAAKHERFSKARVVILLDEVHEYDALLTPLFANGLSSRGLGRPFAKDYEDFVPVVMIMGKESSAEEKMKPFLETSKSWLRTVPLEPFKEGESILAYERVILHPYAGTLLKDVSDRPWVRNRDADAADVDKWHELLRNSENLTCMPSDFHTKDFYYLVQAAAVFGNVLVPATDEDLLKELRDDE